MAKQVKDLSLLFRKKARIINHQKFLQQCKKQDLIPHSMRPRVKISSKNYKSAQHKAGLIFINHELKDLQQRRNMVFQQINTIRQQLSNTLSPEDFTKVGKIHDKDFKFVFSITRKVHVDKLEKLKFEKFATRVTHNPRVSPGPAVINLSQQTFDQKKLDILSKGWKFSIPPKHLPVEEIISNVESALILNKKTINVDPQDIRSLVSNTLRKALSKKKHIEENLTRDEMKVLTDLKKDTNIIITKADKGNTIVILNETEYVSKSLNLLNNNKVYEKVNVNAVKVAYDNVKKALDNLSLTNRINDQLYRKLIPVRPVIPRFYGAPKIHKPDIPLRPIVSTIGSATQKLERYLAGILRSITLSSQHTIRNTKEAVERLKSINILENTTMCSFDVVSLFTSIPLPRLIPALQSALENDDSWKELTSLDTTDIIILTSLCLNNAYFTFRHQTYKQKWGIPMGSALAPVLSEVFLQYIENNIFKQDFKDLQLYMRYVDDCLIIWNGTEDKLRSFLNTFNQQDPDIKFTIELENNHSLPFLDVLITKRETRFDLSVYRKPTHSDRYLRYDSYNHPIIKNSVVYSLVDRAFIVCSSDLELKAELDHIKDVLIGNGYPQQVIDKVISRRKISTKTKSSPKTEEDKPFLSLPYIKGITDILSSKLTKLGFKVFFPSGMTVSSFLNKGKDKITSDPPGVYEIPCSCGDTYIGRTMRSLHHRLKEHADSIDACLKKTKLKEEDTFSALAHHIFENPSHSVDFDQAQLIAIVPQLLKQKIREALEIAKNKPAINKDNGEFRISEIWEPITHRLRTRKKLHPTSIDPTFLRSTRIAAINASTKIRAILQQ